MQISKRLKAVAGLVSPGKVLADVGTDHGYVPIYLVQNQVVENAIAMDVRKGPLSRAMEHIEAFALDQKIETRLSDGLAALNPGEADRIVIAGMGGALMIRIMEDGLEKINRNTEIIMQPQSELAAVREWLAMHAFQILEEEMIYEDGKYYPMMKVKMTEQNMQLSEMELRFGPCLMQKRHPVLKQYLEQEDQKLEEILDRLSEQNSESALQRIIELKKDHLYVLAALEIFETI